MNLTELSQYWPIIVFIIGVIASAAVLHYRVGQNSKLKRALFNEDGGLVYMPKEEVNKEIGKVCVKINKIDNQIPKLLPEDKHTDLCKIANLGLKEHISVSFSSFSDVLIKKMESLHAVVIKEIDKQKVTIDKQEKRINIIDRRTNHLK